MRKADQTSRKKLWTKFKCTRSESARNKLIEHYLPFVRYMAERVSSRLPKTVDPDDLTSAGIFGLLKSIENFDPQRGTRFETYCRLRVKGSMLDELRSQDWIPRETRNRLAKIQSTVTKLKDGLGREPSDWEIAASLEVSLDELRDTILHVTIYTIIPLNLSEIDQYANNGMDSADHLPLFEDEPSTIAHRNEIVELIYNNLTQFEKMIILFYYHEGLTMKEIGEVLKLSESRVCQLHTRLLDRLKEKYSSEY